MVGKDLPGALSARAPSASLSATIVAPPVSNGQCEFIEGTQNQENRRFIGLFLERPISPVTLFVVVLRIHGSALLPATE